MTKRILITVLGLWIAAVPFLGFPVNWKNAIIVVSGLIIALFSYINVKKTPNF